MKRRSWKAHLFIGSVVFYGLGTIAYSASTAHWNLDLRFLLLLTVTVLASRLKIPLPELNSSMSMNLPFLLVAAAWLSLPAVMIVGCTASLFHTIPSKKNSFRWIHVLFNTSCMAMGVGASWATLNTGIILQTTESSERALRLIIAMGIFFIAETTPVAIVLSLTDSRKGIRTWLEILTCTIPYYVLSAALSAVIIVLADNYISWYVVLLSFPVMFGVYRSYRACFRTPRTAPNIQVG